MTRVSHNKRTLPVRLPFDMSKLLFDMLLVTEPPDHGGEVLFPLSFWSFENTGVEACVGCGGQGQHGRSCGDDSR